MVDNVQYPIPRSSPCRIIFHGVILPYQMKIEPQLFDTSNVGYAHKHTHTHTRTETYIKGSNELFGKLSTVGRSFQNETVNNGAFQGMHLENALVWFGNEYMANILICCRFYFMTDRHFFFFFFFVESLEVKRGERKRFLIR